MSAMGNLNRTLSTKYRSSKWLTDTVKEEFLAIFRSQDFCAFSRTILFQSSITLSLQDDKLQNFVVGQIIESLPKQLKKGELVVAMIQGFGSNGYPVLLNQEPFLDKEFHLVESDPFHFPYAQVIKRLSKDRDSFGLLEAADGLRFTYGYEGLELLSSGFHFTDEIVRGTFPSRPPPYMTKEYVYCQLSTHSRYIDFLILQIITFRLVPARLYKPVGSIK